MSRIVTRNVKKNRTREITNDVMKDMIREVKRDKMNHAYSTINGQALLQYTRHDSVLIVV